MSSFEEGGCECILNTVYAPCRVPGVWSFEERCDCIQWFVFNLSGDTEKRLTGRLMLLARWGHEYVLRSRV